MDKNSMLIALFFTLLLGAGLGFFIARIIFWQITNLSMFWYFTVTKWVILLSI